MTDWIEEPEFFKGVAVEGRKVFSLVSRDKRRGKVGVGAKKPKMFFFFAVATFSLLAKKKTLWAITI